MTTLIDNPEMEDTYYGIAIAPLGDDWDKLLALGHHEPKRVLAAFNRFSRMAGWLNVADDLSADAATWIGRLERKHGVFREADPEHGWEDPDCVWFVDWVPADAPGARPVTLLAVA